MADLGALRFSEFVSKAKGAGAGPSEADGAHSSARSTEEASTESPAPQGFAFRTDRKAAGWIDRAWPVLLASEAAVRLSYELTRGDLLGRAVKVGPNQLGRLDRLADECREILGIVRPQVFVTHDPTHNAYTFGTRAEAVIVMHSGLLDLYTDDELRFVLGHECTHIREAHVVTLTTIKFGESLLSAISPRASYPVNLLTQGFQRHAEITCDRGGLLCAKNLEVGTRALCKLMLGTSATFRELDLERYLEQFQEMSGARGRFAELGRSHPALIRRILSLRHFAKSAYYRRALGVGDDGLALEEVDAEVAELIRVA